MALVFCGLGFHPEDLTHRMLSEIEKADCVLLDCYTNFLLGAYSSPSRVADYLADRVGRPVTIAERSTLENDSNDLIASSVDGKTIVILVPGDPFVATTHVALYEAAVREGVPVRIYHNASILSAAPSISGLQAYRFGRIATVTFSDNPSRYAYDIACSNLSIGAHSLVLHDLEVSTGRFVTVRDTLDYFVCREEEFGGSKGLISGGMPCVGLCCVGSPGVIVKAGVLSELTKYSWERAGPPQCTILCASLHPTESEALKTIWSARF